MRNRYALISLLFLLLVLFGCNEPSTDRLLGDSIDQVIGRYGEPRHRFEAAIGDPFYGPSPGVLKTGERFLLLTYLADNDYDIYEIMLVSPDLYKKYIGTDPGDEDWYVIQVSISNTDVVY